MSKMVILGAAESGVGAAVLAKKEGYDVFVTDMGSIKPHYKQLLDSHGIEWEEGGHTEARVLQASEVVKSPGVPQDAPIVMKLRRQGTPVISEIELAGRYSHAKMICITGSNGKTTTTSLVYHIMRQAGMNVGLAGNIGRSLALQVAERAFDYYVIELSSFQLDNMYDFRANIAVLLNITPDHLDRYDFKMQNYVDAKLRITRNQTADDVLIYWKDDPIVPAELARYPIVAHQSPFADQKEAGAEAFLDGDTFRLLYPAPFSMPEAELSLPGRHNLRNMLAAGLVANTLGIRAEVIRRGLSTFRGVEHRMERVTKVRGVQYVNDSKATNVDACLYALDSVQTPVVLILGGKDKGNDYSPLLPLIKQKCRALVFLGADNAKLHDNFDALGLPVADTHSMHECVEACARLAVPGDTVLLSPCCASFDLFKNMEDRGEQFKRLVRALE